MDGLTRTVLIHQWVGILIMVVAFASLVTSIWNIVQNTFFYEIPLPPPGISETEKASYVYVPSLIQRVGWNIPGLIISCAMLIFGYWTYRKGREGVPLISVKS